MVSNFATPSSVRLWRFTKWRAEAQCHLLCQVRPSAALGGADALWARRPPGRLLEDRRCLILRGKSGTRASRADQGVRPTINAASHLSGKVSDIGLKPAPLQARTVFLVGRTSGLMRRSRPSGWCSRGTACAPPAIAGTRSRPRRLPRACRVRRRGSPYANWPRRTE